jgi:hypothetical protein
MSNKQEKIQGVTLEELLHVCRALIAQGANPDNPVLIYSDPEGNSLNTMANYMGLATINAENQMLPKAIDLPTESDADFEQKVCSPDTHIVLGACQEIYWDESQYISIWDEPVPYEVI